MSKKEKSTNIDALLSAPRFLAGLLGFGSHNNSDGMEDLRRSMADSVGVPYELLYDNGPSVHSSMRAWSDNMSAILDSSKHLLSETPVEVETFETNIAQLEREGRTQHQIYMEMCENWVKGISDVYHHNSLETSIDDFQENRMKYKHFQYSNYISAHNNNAPGKLIYYRAYIRTPAREMELSVMRFIFNHFIFGSEMTVRRIKSMYDIFSGEPSVTRYYRMKYGNFSTIDRVIDRMRNGTLGLGILSPYVMARNLSPYVMARNIPTDELYLQEGESATSHRYSPVMGDNGVLIEQASENHQPSLLSDDYPRITERSPLLSGEIIRGRLLNSYPSRGIVSDMEAPVTGIDFGSSRILSEHPAEDPVPTENVTRGRGASALTLSDDYEYVHEYDYTPDNFILHSNVVNPSSLYMGVELEIDEGGKNNLEALHHVYDLNFNTPSGLKDGKYLESESDENQNDEIVYVKSDASLSDGFEIVTHPCTLDYHKKIAYKDLFKYLEDAGYKSHDTATCGFHIHINRDYFGDRKVEQDLKICNLLYLIETNWDNCSLIARRNDNRYSVRLSFFENCDSPLNLFAESVREGKYACVNLKHENTVELRMFKGTLNYDTFISTLEFVKILATIAKNTDVTNVDKLTWNDIEKGFPNQLSEYFHTRKDIKEKNNIEAKKKTEEALQRISASAGRVVASSGIDSAPVSVGGSDRLYSVSAMYGAMAEEERLNLHLRTPFTFRGDPSTNPTFSIRDFRDRGVYVIDSLSFSSRTSSVDAFSRELTEEEKIVRDITDLRSRVRRRGINFMEAQGMNRKIAKLERQLRAIRNNTQTQTFQYNPIQGFQYQPPVEEQISRIGSSLLDNVTPGVLDRIPVLSSRQNFDDSIGTLDRIPVLSNYESFNDSIFAFSRGCNNHPARLNQPAIEPELSVSSSTAPRLDSLLPAIHTFERFPILPYREVQQSINIINRHEMEHPITITGPYDESHVNDTAQYIANRNSQPDFDGDQFDGDTLNVTRLWNQLN